MKNHITIPGRDGAFDAYIARPKALPAPAVVVLQELFGVNADIRKTFVTNWPSRALSRSRPIYSGARNRALTLASPPRLTGSTAFACIRPMTGMRALGMLRTPLTPLLNCPIALAKLPSLGIASAR